MTREHVETRALPMSELTPFILACLDEDLSVTLRIAGNSMSPLVRDRVDAVILTKAPPKLRVGDVPLYLRDNGKYVLHRVVRIAADGSYTMRGDNQNVDEPGIRPDQIRAVAAGFIRRNKPVMTDNRTYRLHSWLWLRCYPYRVVAKRVDYHILRSGAKV